MFRLGKKLEMMLLVFEKMDNGKEKCCFSIESNYENQLFLYSEMLYVCFEPFSTFSTNSKLVSLWRQVKAQNQDDSRVFMEFSVRLAD